MLAKIKVKDAELDDLLARWEKLQREHPPHQLTPAEKIKQAVRQSLTLHGMVWVIYGVLLALTPFALVRVFGPRHGDQVRGWVEIVHPGDLVLIAIALAGGAVGESTISVMMNRHRQLRGASTVITVIATAVIVASMCLFVILARAGDESSAAASWWSGAALLASVCVGAGAMVIDSVAEGREPRVPGDTPAADAE